MNVFDIFNDKPNQRPDLKDNPLANKYYNNRVDNNSNNNMLHDIIGSDLSRQYRISADENEKYEKYGIVYSPERARSGALDIALADRQSNWAKLGNAIAQTVVSEIGLGTAIAFSDVFDAIGQAVGASDHNYSNPITEKLEEWQNAFKNEVAPIYSRPGSGFENGTDFGWWMQNLPSIASSLTLLIPSNLVVGGLSKGAKALVRGTKLANKWDRIGGSTKLMLEEGAKIGLNAGMQRTLENYQEARQVYNDAVPQFKEELDKKVKDGTYQTFIDAYADKLGDIDTSDTLEVAKAIARKSADRTFRDDFVNVGFDIIQLAAIRNLPFRAFVKNKPTVSGRRLDLQSRRFAGKYKTMDELQTLIANRTKGQKVKDLLGDIGYYAGTEGLTQMSEGVEEAINYIAQQEGMNLGKTMLGMEANNGVFSDRLAEYVKAPELWESAFWGWMGGITFNASASAMGKARQGIARRKEDKRRTSAQNEKTGENTAPNTKWSEYFETADDKRIKTSIQNRIDLENQFAEQLSKLNTEGIDPFAPNRKVETEEEKEALRQRLLANRRQSLVLNAMDSGTINMLREYLADKNVQQSLVDAGLIKQEDIEKIVAEDIASIDKIKAIYDKEKKYVQNAARDLTKEKDLNIPLEYQQLIVRNNVENELAKEHLTNLLSVWEREADNLAADFSDKLDPNVDYKTAVKLQFLSGKLADLESEKDAIIKDVESRRSIACQERLKEIESDSKAIRNLIAGINPELEVANLMVAIEGSYLFERDEAGNLVKNPNNPKALAFRKAINDNNKDYFKKIDDRLVNITDEQMQQRKVAEDNFVRALGNKSVKNIGQISKELGTAYASIAALESNIAETRLKIKRTESEVEQEAKNYHNLFNALRAVKIEDSFETIKGLADTYGADNIKQYIAAKLHTPKTPFDIPNLTDADKNTLDDAIDTLNLTAKINENIETNINKILNEWEDIKAAQNEKSSASQNQPKSIQNGQPISNAGNEQKGQEGTEKVSKQAFSTPQQPTAQQPQNNNDSGLNISNINNGTEVSNNGSNTVSYSYTLDMPGTYTVNFNIDDNTNYEHFNNSKLFAQRNGVSVMDNNFIIVKAPKISATGTVVEIGILGLANADNTVEAEQNEVNDAQAREDNSNRSLQDAISPTGVDTSNFDDEDGDLTLEEEQIISDKSKIILESNNIINDIFLSDDPVITDAKLEDIKRELDKLNPNNSEILNELIQSRINEIKEIAKDTNQYAPIGRALSSASIIESKSGAKDAVSSIKQAFDELHKSIDEIIGRHKSELGFEDVDGKVYVNIETLLKYCNAVGRNAIVANILYEHILNYLRQSDKYVIVDKNPNAALKNISINKEEREALRVVDNQSINFDGYCNNVVGKERKDAINEVNNLNIGDEIEYNVTDNNIEFSKNGVIIGTLPRLKTYKKGTDHPMQINDGWITDVKSTNNGIESQLRDLFVKWVVNPNNDSNIDNLYKTILKYAYEQDENEKKRLYREFKNNPEYKKAIKDGYTEDVNIEDNDLRRLEGIVKLFRYVKDVSYENTETLTEEDIATIENTNKTNREFAVNRWFNDVVAPSFAFVSSLEGTGTLKISNITEGERIEVPAEEATVPKQALGTRYKTEDGKIDTNKVKIGISVTGKLHISGNPDISQTPILSNMLSGSGNTFALLLGRNNVHEFIHLFPQRTASSTISNNGKQLIKATKNEIQHRLEEVKTLKDLVSFRYFLHSVFGYTNTSMRGMWNSYTGLFAPIKGNIVVKDTEASIEVYAYDETHENTGTYTFKIQDGKLIVIHGSEVYTNPEDLGKIINNIIDNFAYINVGKDLINSDNGGNTNNDIFSVDKNGKFKVKIGTFEQEYESYNDFLLNEGLVTLSTKPSDDGYDNFNRFGENKGPIQTITVENTISTTPVEKNEQVQTNKFEIPASSIEDVINSKSTNKGLALAKLFMPNVKFNNFYAKLFPKNVIFVNELLNNYANANVSTQTIEAGNESKTKVPAGSIIIGKEWLDELVNASESGRREAVRKLVHEQLHLTLHSNGNEHYIEDIRSIFDEFVKKNKDENANVYTFTTIDKLKERYYDENGKLNAEGLEEFLVESLTSTTLANALNNIEADNKTEKKTLFGKIIDFLVKLFNWTGVTDIKEGSLYEQELNIINDLFGTTKTTKTTKTNKPIQSHPEQLSLSFDEEATEQEEPKEEPKTEQTGDIYEQYADEVDLSDFPASSIAETLFDRGIITKEMQEIKDQAIANGTFMKAPNGKPTNLNERQWLQVRTKAFKDWFGDWENDTANASKVVDENGEPLVVYHGGVLAEKIKTFDKTKLGTTTGSNSAKLGFFFASNKDNSAEYANLRKIEFDGNILYVGKNSKISRIYDYYIDAKNGISHKDYIPFLTDEGYIPNEGVDIEPSYPEYSEYVEVREDLAYNEEYLLPDIEERISAEQQGSHEYNNLLKEKQSILDEINNLKIKLEKLKKEEAAKQVAKQIEEKLQAEKEITIFENELKKLLNDSKSHKGHDYFHISNPGEEEQEYYIQEHAKIQEVFLNIRNLDSKDDKGIKFSDGSYTKQFKDALLSGKDGAVRRNTKDPLLTDVYIVFKPNQIKSATDNIGTFNKEDNNIYDELSIASTTDFVNKFPIEDQAEVRSAIDNGEISIKCN